MTKISALTAASYTDLDGAEVLPIVDSGTTKKVSLTETGKYIVKTYPDKPVDQGTTTATPTTVPNSPGKRNVWWVNTSGGSVNLSSIGTIGLLPGQSAIFRKTSTDSNTVTFTATVGGSGLTGSMTMTLDKHYSVEPREIELVWDGSGWTFVSTSSIPSSFDYYASEYGFSPSATAANNVTYLTNAIAAAVAANKTLVIEAGTYQISSAWVRAQVADLRVIGIGLPVLQYTGTIAAGDTTSTTSKNQCVFSVTTGGSIRLDGVKFKGWNTVVRVETDGTTRDYGTIRVENCEFENCNHAVNTADDASGPSLTSGGYAIDECDEFVFSGNKCKDMYCSGLRWFSRRTKTVRVTENIIDGVLTAAPWYVGDKSDVAVVARSNHALSGTTSIDGVTLTSGVTRVLCVGQTTASQNGIYVANSGSWTRAADLAAASTFTANVTTVKVTGGSYNNYATSSYPGAVWRCTSSGTTGTNNMTWEMKAADMKSGMRIIGAMPYNRGSGSASNDADSNYRDLAYVIANNVVRNIKADCGPIGGSSANGAGTGATGWAVDGINVDGEHSKVIGNHVENVYSRAYTQCQGIYVKIRSGIVANNTVHNAGHYQGAIAIKGQPGANASDANPEGFDYLLQSAEPYTNLALNGDLYGYEMLCVNNTITASDGASYPRWGISIWIGPAINVSGNMISGTNNGIECQLSPVLDTTRGYRSLHLQNNIIRRLTDCNGPATGLGLGFLNHTLYQGCYGIKAPSSHSIITGNTFEFIIASVAHADSIAAGIFLTATSDTYEKTNVNISNNNFDNINSSSSSYAAGILVPSSTSDESKVTLLNVSYNYFGIIKSGASAYYSAFFIADAPETTGTWTFNRHSASSLAPYFTGATPGMLVFGNVGTTAPVNYGAHHSFILTDGVTAPSTVSAQAQIYVDTADGDLKVKFGDGTTKTIVVDT